MNMCRLLKLLFCISCVFVVFSCGINSKDSYLKSFEKFIEKIEQTESFSSAEITSIKKKYLDYSETYYHKYEAELSNIEEGRIIELKARYYAVLTKQGIMDVSDTLKDLGEQASEFINEILE